MALKRGAELMWGGQELGRGNSTTYVPKFNSTRGPEIADNQKVKIHAFVNTDDASGIWPAEGF